MKKGEAATLDYLERVFDNVVVQPRDAREASDVFYKQKVWPKPANRALPGRCGRCVHMWLCTHNTVRWGDSSSSCCCVGLPGPGPTPRAGSRHALALVLSLLPLGACALPPANCHQHMCVCVVVVCFPRCLAPTPTRFQPHCPMQLSPALQRQPRHTRPPPHTHRTQNTLGMSVYCKRPRPPSPQVGDVLLTYENEVILTNEVYGAKALPYLVPPYNIRIECPLALVDQASEAGFRGLGVGCSSWGR